MQSPCQARRLRSQFLDEFVISGIKNGVALFHVVLSCSWHEIFIILSWQSLDEESRDSSRLCSPSAHHPQREDVILRHHLVQKILSEAGNYKSHFYVFHIASSLHATSGNSVVTSNSTH
jgi:hypothetical protein